MRVTNTTAIPAETIREVIRFVCPPGVSGFDVRVTNTSGPWWGNGRADPNEWSVLLRVGPAKIFPRRPATTSRGAYLPTPWFADRTEALVYIAAHELRHLWQARVPRGRRVWGARGQYSERDADAYAIRMLRAWRRRPIGD